MPRSQLQRVVLHDDHGDEVGLQLRHQPPRRVCQTIEGVAAFRLLVGSEDVPADEQPHDASEGWNVRGRGSIDGSGDLMQCNRPAMGVDDVGYAELSRAF